MGTFEPNPDFLPELRSEPEYRELIEEKTEALLEGAIAAAPVHTGTYVGGLESEINDGPEGPVGRVNATDWASHWVEWGSQNNPPYAPLRKGAAAAGLTYEDDGRG